MTTGRNCSCGSAVVRLTGCYTHVTHVTRQPPAMASGVQEPEQKFVLNCHEVLPSLNEDFELYNGKQISPVWHRCPAHLGSTPVTFNLRIYWPSNVLKRRRNDQICCRFGITFPRRRKPLLAFRCAAESLRIVGLKDFIIKFGSAKSKQIAAGSGGDKRQRTYRKFNSWRWNKILKLSMITCWHFAGYISL